MEFQYSKEWLDMKESIRQMKKNIELICVEQSNLKDEVMTMQETLKTVIKEQTIQSKMENESKELKMEINIESGNIEEKEQYSEESIEYNDLLNEMITDRPTHKRFTNTIMNAFGRKRKKVKNDDCYIYNTESIYSHTVVAIQEVINTPSSTKQGKAWLLSLLSFAVISVQLFTMNSLISESSHPTCATHTDCREGQACNAFDENDMRQPRCQSCIYLGTEDLEDSCSEYDVLKDLEITAHLVWFEKDFTTHIDESIIKSFSNDSNLASTCLARQYCINTHLATVDVSSVWSQNDCSFLDIYMSKISFDQMFVFGGVIILFACILTKDIEESLIESVLLEYILHPQQLSSSTSIFCLTMVVRAALNMKRYFLPWMTAGAGASILISGTFSTKNVVLELLTVLFTLEADKLFPSLILPPKDLLSIDNLVADARSHYDISKPFWVTHFQGVVVSAVLLVCIFAMYPTLVNWTRQPACTSVDVVLYIIFAFVAPISFVILETFVNAFTLKSTLSTILRLSRKVVAFMIHALLWALNVFAIYKWNMLGNFGRIEVSKLVMLSILILLMLSIFVDVRCHHHVLKSTKCCTTCWDVILVITWLFLSSICVILTVILLSNPSVMLPFMY